MNANIVLWIYVALLIVGGLIGFLKAGSKASIIASSVFAVLIALCAAGIITQKYAADALIGLVLIVFIMRLAKTKKFMPSGMMLIISVIALAAHLMLK